MPIIRVVGQVTYPRHAEPQGQFNGGYMDETRRRRITNCCFLSRPQQHEMQCFDQEYNARYLGPGIKTTIFRS